MSRSRSPARLTARLTLCELRRPLAGNFATSFQRPSASASLRPLRKPLQIAGELRDAFVRGDRHPNRDPRDGGSTVASSGIRGQVGDAGSGDDREDSSGVFRPEQAHQDDLGERVGERITILDRDSSAPTG